MSSSTSDLAHLLDELASITPAEAVARLRATGDARGALTRLSDEVERLSMSNLSRALGVAPVLVGAADRLSEPLVQARTRRALAHALAYSNRFDDALSTLADAVQAADRSGDPLEGARVRMATLHALARTGRLNEAIEAGEAALGAFTRAGDSLLAARAHINLGVVRRMADQPRRAVDHFDLALTLLADQPMLSAQLQSNRAEALLDLHEFQAAEEAFRSALAGLEALGASRAATIVEGNLADLTSRQGRIQEGLAFFERARRRLASDGSPGDVARLWIEQAEALLSAGSPVDASDAFQTAIPTLREHGMTQELARALLGLARSRIELGQWSQAGDLLSEARSLLEPMNNRTGLARADMLDARVHDAAGDSSGARRLLEDALARLVDRPADACVAHLQLAGMQLGAGDLSDAADHVRSAMAVAEALDLAPLRAELLHARAKIHASQGRVDDAAQDFAAAIEQTERVRGTLNAEALRAAFIGRRSSVFADAASFSLDRGEIALAFDRIERARARSMQEAAAQPAAAQVRPTGDPAERSILLEIDRLRHELTALHSHTGEVGVSARGSSQDRISGVRRREQALRLAEQRLAALAPRRAIDRQPAALADIQGSLGVGRALLEFFDESGSVSAMVLTDQGVHLRRRLASLDSVRRAVEGLAFQIDRAIIRGLPGGPAGQRLIRDAEDALRKLHTLLLAPLADVLEHTARLTVVPFALLHRVPFHALMNDAGEPEFARRAISVAPSATVAMLLRDRSPLRQARPLVIGVSDAAIPCAEDEARAAAAASPDADVLIGSAATVENVSQAMQARSWIHIATHARFVASSPSASGLRLADGWLSAWDLGEIALSGARVVLSGCSTGRSEASPGDELMGLIRALLSAGASSLVLSHWALHDQTAMEMVAEWYTSMYDNDMHSSSFGAGSLSRAQLGAYRQGRHPAAWASFFEIGFA